MSQKLKKTLNQNLNDKKEDEKENKKSNFKKSARKNTKNPGKAQFEDEVPEQLVTPNVNRKPLGFWSKKVQDLEENAMKKKKSALYEFSGTDESDSSYRMTAKKKIKRKPRLKRKKQPSEFNKNNCVKTKKKLPELEIEAMGNSKQPLDMEQIVLKQEKEKQTDEGEKFSPGPQLALTSTPAANRNNFIWASNFMFLSPITSETVEGNVTKCPSLKQSNGSPVVHLNQETPKLNTKLKRISFRRVLRNGKILDR